MLNTPVCYLLWVHHQVPVHKQECLLESCELLHQVLLSTVHSHPLLLGRPRTSLDHWGWGLASGLLRASREPESLTAIVTVVQGMGQDGVYPQFPSTSRLW